MYEEEKTGVRIGIIACFFPEFELRPFFYDVNSDVAPWTAIVETIVDPPDARILLASVRSEIPVGINFTERFTLVSSPTGRFSLHSVLPLTLPPQLNRTKLYVTVVCNDEAFALFTVRVTSVDNGTPQFYNEPYYVDVNESLRVGETVITPVVVIDWDSNHAVPRLRIQGVDSPFKVVTKLSNSTTPPIQKVGSNHTETRQPTLVLLKLVKPITRLPITLKLVAEDVDDCDRSSVTSIHIRAKPKPKAGHPGKFSAETQIPNPQHRESVPKTEQRSEITTQEPLSSTEYSAETDNTGVLDEETAEGDKLVKTGKDNESEPENSLFPVDHATIFPKSIKTGEQSIEIEEKSLEIEKNAEEFTTQTLNSPTEHPELPLNPRRNKDNLYKQEDVPVMSAKDEQSSSIDQDSFPPQKSSTNSEQLEKINEHLSAEKDEAEEIVVDSTQIPTEHSRKLPKAKNRNSQLIKQEDIPIVQSTVKQYDKVTAQSSIPEDPTSAIKSTEPKERRVTEADKPISSENESEFQVQSMSSSPDVVSVQDEQFIDQDSPPSQKLSTNSEQLEKIEEHFGTEKDEPEEAEEVGELITQASLLPIERTLNLPIARKHNSQLIAQEDTVQSTAEQDDEVITARSIPKDHVDRTKSVETKGQRSNEAEEPVNEEKDTDFEVHSLSPFLEVSTNVPKKIKSRNLFVEYGNDVSESSTRFEKCAMRVSMPENSEWTMIDMVNPDGTFEINQGTGEVFIRDNRIMDRELFSQLELVAEIHGSTHMTKCARTRVTVELLDVNDNKPAFEKEMYNFLISDEFPVEGSVGIVRARDIDEVNDVLGEAGRVTYRLLNDSVPFEIRKKGKDGEIFTTAELFGSEEFQFIVEARDNAEPFLSSEVPVNILVTSSGLKSRSVAIKKRKGAPKRKASGVISATLKPLDLNSINDSSEASATLEDEATTSLSFTTQTTTFRSTTPRTTRVLSTVDISTLSPDLLTSTSSSSATVPATFTDEVDAEIEVESSTNVVSEASEEEKNEDSTTTNSIQQMTVKSSHNSSFGFVESLYYFEVFGPPREGDVMGRVEARPSPQMYAVERTAVGAFKVDPDIGEISVGEGLGRLANGNHTFLVSATDGLRTAQTAVTVRLDTRKNRNEAVPRFERNRYVFRVAENRSPSVVGVVRAYHVALSSTDVTLKYEIIKDDQNVVVPFRVHPVSGEVMSESPLDHELNKDYEFKIRACLSVNPTNCGYTIVVVIVDDLNDNAPRFSSSEFRLSLPSDLPTGSDVLVLKATDPDSGPNGDVGYAINPASAVFEIDNRTGKVRTIAPLTESLYNLEVEAFDHGEPKNTDVTKLIISVHGTNPSAPFFDQTGAISARERLTANDGPFELTVVAEDQSTVFKRRTYTILHIDIVGDTSLRFLPLPSTIYISTDKAVGSVVLRASAFTSSATTVRFRVLENDAQFVMDDDLLRVATHLSAGETTLTIRAETENAHSDHRLRVVVMFDRDKYPVFPQLTYDIDIPIDSIFPLVAHRFDAQLLNGTLGYRFFPDNVAPHGLHISAETGELSVTSEYVNTPSNHDTQFAVVRAVNLDYPEFYSDVGVAISLVSSRTIRFPHSIYRLQITENVPVGTALFPPLEVFPKSSAVTYSINPPSPLSILPNGTLVINSPVDLEALPVDQADNLHFVVTATLADVQAVTKLQLKIKDVNEFAPLFEKKHYEASIREDAAPGSLIVRVRATDDDRTEGTHLLYKIVGGSGRELVFIQEDGTIILGDSALDRETLREFDVIVEVIDRSGNKDTATVRVNVEDINDNAPFFPEKHLIWNVTEGSNGATFKIAATDKDSERNADIDFRIVEGDPRHIFALHKASAQTAILTLTRPLDHEAQKSYELTVEATDRGDPPLSSTAVVTVNVIDRNDNPPIFQKMNYEQKVSSDLPVGYPILTVSVNDADRDRLSFSLSGDQACSWLAVDPLGVVSFTKGISGRGPGNITCVISASDGTHTANATLRLNLFRNEQPTVETPQTNRAPTFAREVYTITITAADRGQVLKRVKATDPDGDVVSYSIEPPEFRNLFEVDGEGQVTLRVPLDHLKQTSYSFLVVAEDNGHPVMSSFTNIRVKVPENENHVVTSDLIEATASTVTRPPYSRGSSRNSQSTVIPTSSPTEDGTSSSMQETSKRTPSSATEEETTPQISIVTDSAISFTRKKYTYAMRSDSPVGTYLGQIELNNSNAVKLIFRRNKKFVIDADGWIRSVVVFASPEKIEDEILAVKDGTTVAAVPFLVHVLAPSSLGTSSALPSTMTETFATAEPFTTEDSLFSTGKSEMPSTDKETTETILTKTAETAESATVNTSPYLNPSTVHITGTTIGSTDGGSEVVTRSTLATEASSSQPKLAFTKSTYFAFVPEGQYINGIRLAVKPEPLSVNPQTAVRYEIDESSPNIPFFITSDGQLIIFDVDRESQSSYMFTIKATSPEFGVAKAMMNVTILDTNDNYPIFDVSPPEIGVYKDAPIGTPLFRFSARDKDTDNYGVVTYGLEEQESPFSINPNDGTLVVARALDYTPEYSLTVFAKDNGRPSLKSTQKMAIRVFDPRIESPHFQKDLPEKVVLFGTQPHSEIAAVLAGPTINTKPNQERILYGLVDDHNGLFTIEDEGRLILSRRPMDDEKNRYIQLNVTAENSHGKDWTLLNVFIEGESVSTTASTTAMQGTGSEPSCVFLQKVYTTEIMENQRGRKRLLKVTSNCESEGRPYEYSFSYPLSEFELDPKTGEVFAVLPLDRERRSYNFLYVNVSSGAPPTARRFARENPIIEQAKSNLAPSQTLVVVRVLDENDNAPIFLYGTDDDDAQVATVDWQARLFTPVIRLRAKDADERPQLSYSISGTGSDYFLVNSTSGLVILGKSLADYSGDSFQLTATVTDGLHIVPTPLRIYVISPSSSLVQLTAEVPHSQIDQRIVERTLNELNGLDNHLLVKQPYIDNQGHADPTRSHLFVYALDPKTRIPYLKEDLAKVLEHHAASLLTSSHKISEISLLSPPPTAISAFDLALALLLVLLLLILLAACCILASHCKKKRAIATSDREYMVSSLAGPRPYNVKEVSRTTAQRVLSARPLPEPMTNQIEVAVSPIFTDGMVSTNKSDTTKAFSNSVRERPSLLQSALARQKVHASEPKPTPQL
ncbi:hypothetical protein RB195_002572 [Necator americanus]|uniref:Cadherin domain-containing protein n=1 Tax=Necator americanus TaxID=51031 RepID=A0ABR1DK38_NECAM